LARQVSLSRPGAVAFRPCVCPGAATAAALGPGAQAGFTLIEMLLVAAIIAIVTAVVAPMMGRSMRGQRLRIAARTAAMAGRYARTMAILQQQDMAVRIDVARANVSVGPADWNGAGQEPSEAAGFGQASGVEVAVSGAEAGSALFEGPEPETLPPSASGRAGAVLSRSLEGVAVRQIEFLDDTAERHADGIVSIPYRCNGTCRPYRIELADDMGEAVVVEVDALGGSRLERAR